MGYSKHNGYTMDVIISLSYGFYVINLVALQGFITTGGRYLI